MVPFVDEACKLRHNMEQNLAESIHVLLLTGPPASLGSVPCAVEPCSQFPTVDMSEIVRVRW